ncbi:MAG: hypothetical protein AAFP19_17190 [Bacteroidota bacterium]
MILLNTEPGIGQDLFITVLDKGLLALIALLVGFYFNRLLQERKARDSMLETITAQRVKAYQRLWEATKVAEFAREQEISETEKKDLSNKLTEWYYKDGGAMFLSFDATKSYGKAKEVLVNPQSSLYEVKKAFSDIRTQLKKDLKVYTAEEEKKQVIDPEKIFKKEGKQGKSTAD